MPLTRLDRVGTFVERVQALGDRLGPLRITVQSPRDDGLLTFLQGSLPPELDVAYDFRDESWDGVERPPPRERLRRGALPLHPAARASLLRGRPARARQRLRPPAYVYFRHEDEPTAPEYALRLLQMAGS